MFADTPGTLRSSDYPSAHTGGKQLIVKHYATNSTSKCSTLKGTFSVQRVTTCYALNIEWKAAMFRQAHHTWTTTVAAASADLTPQITHKLMTSPAPSAELTLRHINTPAISVGVEHRRELQELSRHKNIVFACLNGLTRRNKHYTSS